VFCGPVHNISAYGHLLRKDVKNSTAPEETGSCQAFMGVTCGTSFIIPCCCDLITAAEGISRIIPKKQGFDKENNVHQVYADEEFQHNRYSLFRRLRNTA